MDQLTAARSLMALSLGFHIIFACIGMVMPFFMSRAYWVYWKHKDAEHLELTKMWMKGVAIFFATGAVSGTALSFELGLLWPEFMAQAGSLIGMPFSWEGAAFFLEAIALGIFLYGFDRVPIALHWATSLVVGIAGVMSGVFVVAVNGWMNSPTGFTMVDGKFTDIDPVKAMFNPAWFHQSHHMTLGAFTAVSVAVLGIHAYLLFKNRRPELQKKAIKVVLPFFVLSTLLHPLSGDHAAKSVAQLQPMKLAAMESHWETKTHAPIKIAGIEIPGALSFLAHGNFNAEVKGMNDFPEADRPPVPLVHFSFQLMVIIGTLLAGLGVVAGLKIWRQKTFPRWLLILFMLAAPLGFLAVEAGWVVTEVGRQPWIIYGLMRTKDAVTPVPGLHYAFYFYSFFYVFLFALVMWLLWRQVKAPLKKVP